MKKLKLNLQEFNNTEVLTRSQLKNVLGGYLGGTSAGGCGSGKPACSSGFHCCCETEYKGCYSNTNDCISACS